MRRLLLVLCLLGWASGAHAAVAFDANATTDCTANSRDLAATGLTCANLTVGSGANRAVICQVGLSSKTVTTPTMVWDFGAGNQSMALIVGANVSLGTNGRAELWGLVAPASGAKTVKYAAAAGTSDITINCVAWTGVDQTGGTTSFPHSTSAAAQSTTAAVTVTSATGNATMDSTVNDSGLYSLPTQTQTYNDGTPNLFSGAGSRVTTSGGSITHSWTISVNANWVSVGTDILASAGGGGGCTAKPTLMLMGVGNCGG